MSSVVGERAKAEHHSPDLLDQIANRFGRTDRDVELVPRRNLEAPPGESASETSHPDWIIFVLEVLAQLRHEAHRGPVDDVFINGSRHFLGMSARQTPSLAIESTWLGRSISVGGRKFESDY